MSTMIDRMKVNTDDLVNSDEVAQLLGLSLRQGVSTYRARYDDFPEPVIEKGRCLLWRRQDIARWREGRSTNG